MRAAEQLRFLAAHHVRRMRIALRQSGQYADIARLAIEPDRAIGNCRKPGGHVDITRFDPALLGAGHAADDHGQVGAGPDLGQMLVEHVDKAGLARRRHAFAGPALRKNLIVLADQPEPETRRSPVHRDELRFSHQT
mgnify:CR=1 FL=1